MERTTSEKSRAEGDGFETPLGRCLVEGDPEAESRVRRSRRRTFGASLATETLLVGVFVAVPLLTSVAQPQLRPNLSPQLTFFGTWHERNQAQQSAPEATVRAPQIRNPFSPTSALHRPSHAARVEAPGDVPTPAVPDGYVPGATQAIPIARMEPPAEPARIESLRQQEKRPLKLSEGVLEAQLISRIEPQYPTLAVLTKTEGAVRLHAIISRDGRITSLEVISGHPFLVKAALDAVRQWRYRPTMLNGELVEVETSITIVFQLHQ